MAKLGDQDLPLLIEVLHPFASKWRELGLALSLTPAELNCIESKPVLFSSGPVSYLREVLYKWINRPTASHDESATIFHLERALQNVGLGSITVKLRSEIQHLWHKGKDIIVIHWNVFVSLFQFTLWNLVWLVTKIP